MTRAQAAAQEKIKCGNTCIRANVRIPFLLALVLVFAFLILELRQDQSNHKSKVKIFFGHVRVQVLAYLMHLH